MQDQADAGTRERLLAAAREVFAERGVKEATVRDICAKAGANVAAVNYYFGSKEKLFMAVLAEYMQAAHLRFPIDMDLAPGAPAKDRLKAYVRSLLYKFLGDGDPLYEKLGMLLTKEFIDPSDQFDVIMERFIMPQHEVLLGIVRELMPESDERSAHLCAAGVVGYCLLFDHMRAVIRRMCPEMALESLGVELLANFIFEYSLAGIERMKGFKE
ncbi:MAG: CerR family C-terminal domain-containing protein [Humidesulfovibrio sp.]|uniref:CerR family C-terminal domain-containing protein n=1 Tax=Humidesulfovibrio sp. TaxID=2910988 RepID=UPI0027F16C38|nr:CerR family C-terminal domain-containing protein [Humidesulfovibrio sp.]MDQ7834199.1 CerR family C-terminal domain-containing protein [Humidesulfovibrio sp.]